MGLVRASTLLTAEDARTQRRILAHEAHIDYILTCHDPSNVNMSWDTAINECLIVLSYSKTNSDKPTRFINLHRFPSSQEDALQTIENAVNGTTSFSGEYVDWDYARMRDGDWSPSAFASPTLVEKMQEALAQTERLRTDLIGAGGSTPPLSLARWTIRYLEVMLTSKST